MHYGSPNLADVGAAGLGLFSSLPMRKDSLMNPEQLLNLLLARYREIIGDNLVGMYIHGSYAMSGFNPDKSDLDYILVCEQEPEDHVKRNIMDATFAYQLQAPAKGLEMHLVQRSDVMNPVWPPRFLLHASPAHINNYLSDPTGYVGWIKGDDPDLTAHFAVTYERGRALYDPAVRKLFCPVPRKAYLESFLSDIGWNPEDAMYHILNRCRTAAYLAEGCILSKREGAEWALNHLEQEYHSLIEEALEAYQSNRVMEATPMAEVFCKRIEKLLSEEVMQ